MTINMKDINDFALKWLDKFDDENIDCYEMIDHYLADDCETLGFKMDCGKAFSEKYGEASYRYEILKRFINEIDDEYLLGSAIYSRWRYFNHWAYDAKEILESKNRNWFILALSRLEELSR